MTSNFSKVGSLIVMAISSASGGFPLSDLFKQWPDAVFQLPTRNGPSVTHSSLFRPFPPSPKKQVCMSVNLEPGWGGGGVDVVYFH